VVVAFEGGECMDPLKVAEGRDATASAVAVTLTSSSVVKR
jgi:hypothetical protein